MQKQANEAQPNKTMGFPADAAKAIMDKPAATTLAIAPAFPVTFGGAPAAAANPDAATLGLYSPLPMTAAPATCVRA